MEELTVDVLLPLIEALELTDVVVVLEALELLVTVGDAVKLTDCVGLVVRLLDDTPLLVAEGDALSQAVLEDVRVVVLLPDELGAALWLL